MLRSLHVWGLASLAIAAVACTTVLGDTFVVQDGDGGGGGAGNQGGTGEAGEGAVGGSPTSGSPGGGGSNVICDTATHVCVPDPGQDWNGPITLAALSAGCADGYPQEVSQLFDGLSVPASSCACSCGAPNVTCPSTMSVIGYAAANCVSGQGMMSLPPNTCYTKLTASASHALVVPDPIATCAVGQVTADIQPTSWATELAACGGATLPNAMCPDSAEQCVPLPGNAQQPGICYTRDGDHTCPAGYDDRTLRYRSVSENRACPSSCSCAHNDLAQCEVAVSTYFGINCSNLAGTGTAQSDDNSCLINNSVNSIRPQTPVVDFAGMCISTDPAPTGDALPTDATTVCCR